VPAAGAAGAAGSAADAVEHIFEDPEVSFALIHSTCLPFQVSCCRQHTSVSTSLRTRGVLWHGTSYLLSVSIALVCLAGFCDWLSCKTLDLSTIDVSYHVLLVGCCVVVVVAAGARVL
jgi:hypothetical protein